MEASVQNLILLETDRLYLRYFNHHDANLLFPLLSDAEVMQFYPRVLKQRGTRDWLDTILESYEKYGIGWLAVHQKKSLHFVGQAGLLLQRVDGEEKVGLGYMLHKKYWKRGYAYEAARCVLHYGFSNLKLKHIICLVRPANEASNQTALKLGFRTERSTLYRGYEHQLYEMTQAAYRLHYGNG